MSVNLKNGDNRNYDYGGQGFYERQEFAIINRWIPEGASVIDLACGNGSLIHYLLERKARRIRGIELAPSGVEYARSHGYAVTQGRIDERETYKNFSDNFFDFAVCNVTIQMVMFPEIVLTEMKRIARQQIISFPNFAFIGNRLELMFRGRLPRPMLHGHQWYNTGQIHQLSLKDFKDTCRLLGLKIIKQSQVGRWGKWLGWAWPNAFSKAAVFCCTK